MVLKEAYRYQNYLDNIIREAQSYLTKKDFITKTTQTHDRKKSNPDAENETVDVKTNYTVEFMPMDLVNFIVKAIDEKQKLSNAIVEAKKSTEIDIDSSIAMNKIKQGYISVLNMMANTKSSESVTRGTGYKFNADGDQTSYYYDIENVTTISYDRNDVRGLAKKLQKETDDISTKLDLIQITTEVQFAPQFDINNTLEELVLV